MLKVLTHFWIDTWEKAKRSFWLFFGYLLSQTGVQAMNFVIGLLIIRFLNKDGYAAYTIMNTLVPVMLMLSDTGIGTGIFAIGRLIWEDDEKMGRLVNTGLQLRRRFAAVSFCLVGPFLAWMLNRNHVPILDIVLLTTISLTSISFQLTGAVVKAVLQLRQNFTILMKMGLMSTFLRLCLVGWFIAVFQISAVLAVLAGTCSIILETYIAVRATKPQIAWAAPPDPAYKVEIFSLVKRTLPLTLYYCVSGQLNVWLLGVFGSSHQVADIGAASRLGIIFITVTSSFAAIMVSKFARANGRRRLMIQSIQIIGCLALVLFGLTALVWIWPTPFIWLLGPQYTNISGLLWLVVLSTGVNSLAGSIFNLNMCKGWIPPAAVTIPIEIGTQIVLLSILDVSKTENVLILSTLSAIPVTIVNGYMLFRQIRKEPE